MKILLALLAGLALASATEAQVRPSVETLTVAQVRSLQRGFAVMIARNTAPRSSPDFRRSLQFWANTHAHFGGDCSGPVSGAGMAGVQPWVAQGTVEGQAWCSCVHGQPHFATWHRLFIDAFEAVLREASGDPGLMLPFWNYAANPRLPASYRARTTADGDPNPLFVVARRAALNAGSSGLATTTASAANAMSATDYVTFSRRLEQGPHNPVHCAVGVAGCGSGLMGAFATAGSDPIFWSHHANIDRLYECWSTAAPGRRPTGALLERTFPFANRQGGITTYRVRDALTPAQLGYRYPAGGAGCPPPAAAAGVAQADDPTLLGQTTEAELDVTPTEMRTLLIRGVAAVEQPGAMFDVYLANARGVRVHVGTLAMLGSDDHHGQDFEFDVTEAARVLKLGPDAEPHLYIEATDGLDGSTPQSAGLNREAHVTYRSATLR